MCTRRSTSTTRGSSALPSGLRARDQANLAAAFALVDAISARCKAQRCTCPSPLVSEQHDADLPSSGGGRVRCTPQTAASEPSQCCSQHHDRIPGAIVSCSRRLRGPAMSRFRLELRSRHARACPREALGIPQPVAPAPALPTFHCPTSWNASCRRRPPERAQEDRSGYEMIFVCSAFLRPLGLSLG